jgi:hypothetical protein
VRDYPPGKELTPSDCERVIVGLLVNKLIKPICRYTAYEYVNTRKTVYRLSTQILTYLNFPFECSTVVYLESTEMASSFITSTKARMRLPLPKKAVKTASKRIRSVCGVMEWHTTKRKRATKKKNPPKKKNTRRRSTEMPATDIIVLLDESEDDYNTNRNGRKPVARKTASHNPTEPLSGQETGVDEDNDSEFEFDE